MKPNKICAASAVLALAVALTACGGSASTAASSTASSEAASSVAASSEAASSEAAESAEYTVYNTTGSTVSELYLYEAGSEDKGENLAGEAGLADGSIHVFQGPWKGEGTAYGADAPDTKEMPADDWFKESDVEGGQTSAPYFYWVIEGITSEN